VDIFLTDEGRALEEKSAAVMQCISEAVGMNAGQASDMLSTIHSLAANLNQAAGQAPKA
jgi:hypothetical protein